MPKPNGHRARWVQREAAKHTSPESIRLGIATAEKHIDTLAVAGDSRETEIARETHHELIRVLTKRLADFA